MKRGIGNGIIGTMLAVSLMAGGLIGCSQAIEPVAVLPTLPSRDLPSPQVPTGSSVAPTASSVVPTAPTDASTSTTVSTDATRFTNPIVSPTEEQAARGQAIAAFAQTLLGKPFEYGCAGPDRFDNSGFVFYCFDQQGISVPRTTGLLYKAGVAVDREALLAGDLVFFTMSEMPEVREAQYVGLYLGDDRFLACSNEERPVDVLDMTGPYFEERYVGARRCF